ncbi:MAG: hypothetical protein GYA57_15325 [Myxococcales bacterium]|nr:hypothetical protein [Myxococcales bacterium]
MTDPLCINDRTVEICRVENRREERPAADAAAPMPWADDVRADSPRGLGPRAGDGTHNDCAKPPAQEQAAPEQGCPPTHPSGG